MPTGRERVWASPIQRRSAVRGGSANYIGRFSGSFFNLWLIIWFCSPCLTYPRALPNLCVCDGVQPRGLWDHILASCIMAGGGVPPPVDPQEAFLHMCNVSLVLQGWGIYNLLMAPHSSTLAWKIPWTEEPGRLQSMGLHRVGHD